VKRFSLLTFAVLGTVALPAIAAAENAKTTTDLNMRAGPSTGYPVVEVIPGGAPVTVHGCIADYDWCDTSWQDARGWVAGDYLRYFYRQSYVPVIDYGPRLGLPIVAFSVDTYWDRYYRRRPWYRDRDRWRSVRIERPEEHRRHRIEGRNEERRREVIRGEERRGYRAERRDDRDHGRVEFRREQREERTNRAERMEQGGGRTGTGRGGGVERRSERGNHDHGHRGPKD